MAMATSYGSFCFLLVGGFFGGWCWSTVILLCFFYRGCTHSEAMDKTSLLGAQTEIGQYFSLHLRCAGIWSIDDVALSFCWRRWNEGRSFSLFHLSRSFALVRPGFCFCLVWFLVWLWLCLVVGVACVLCCLCFASFFWIPGLTWFSDSWVLRMVPSHSIHSTATIVMVSAAQDQKEWQLSFLRFFETNVKNFGFETFTHHIVLFYLFNYCIHRHSCRRQWRSHVWITWKIILLHHMWNCTERYEI